MSKFIEITVAGPVVTEAKGPVVAEVVKALEVSGAFANPEVWGTLLSTLHNSSYFFSFLMYLDKVTWGIPYFRHACLSLVTSIAALNITSIGRTGPCGFFKLYLESSKIKIIATY